MVDIKLKKPGVGFYLLTVSTLLSIAAFIMYSLTYDALGYASDKWVIALMVVAFWCFGCLMLTALISGNAPKITDVFYWADVMALTLATFKFITPCLSPMGIYFTVGAMGDFEANAIGVPRAIVGAILFVIAILTLIVSAFCSGALMSIEEKIKRLKEKTERIEQKIKSIKEKADSIEEDANSEEIIKKSEEKINKLEEKIKSIKEQPYSDEKKQEKIKKLEKKIESLKEELWMSEAEEITDAATEAPKIYCTNCGSELVSDAKFCGMCGAAVADEARDGATEENAVSEKSEVDHAE